MARKLRIPKTVAPETTLYRFTLEEIHDADHEMFGFCLACREIRESTEPDAENYACEVCGEDAVRQRRAEKWAPVFGNAARERFLSWH